MTTVQITLPDQLAEEAKRAGVLSSEAVEQWLREELRRLHAHALTAAMDRMAAVDEPPLMTPDEVARDIAKLREEKHRNSAQG